MSPDVAHDATAWPAVMAYRLLPSSKKNPSVTASAWRFGPMDTPMTGAFRTPPIFRPGPAISGDRRAAAAAAAAAAGAAASLHVAVYELDSDEFTVVSGGQRDLVANDLLLVRREIPRPGDVDAAPNGRPRSLRMLIVHVCREVAVLSVDSGQHHLELRDDGPLPDRSKVVRIRDAFRIRPWGRRI